MKKVFGTLLILAAIGVLVWGIAALVRANYEYTNDYKAHWNLADKSSTIAEKSKHLDNFVSALDNSGLHGSYDAIWSKTSDNSFDKNFEALKSLQTRLHEIKDLDPNSFAYQTAIQQITAQEQGEADSMLSVFHGNWMKVHHYWQWNFFLAALYVIAMIVIGIVGGVLIAMDREYYY